VRESFSADASCFLVQPEEAIVGNERELIDTGTDKRYVRRDEQGQFKESDDQGRSLSQDVKQKAKTAKPRNQGDRGD
jgi:hypothetical protein